MQADKTTTYQSEYYGEKLNYLQEICDFNVYWLASISPLMIREHALGFFVLNRDKFKRKMKVREFMRYEMILTHGEYNTWEEFAQRIIEIKNESKNE